MSEVENQSIQEREQLLHDSIASLEEYLPKLTAGIEKILDHLTAQREGEAFALLANATEGLQWVFEIAILTKPTLERMEISFDEEHLIGILTELTEAMENHDLVLLADLLEYEILEILCQWQKSFIKKMS